MASLCQWHHLIGWINGTLAIAAASRVQSLAHRHVWWLLQSTDFPVWSALSHWLQWPLLSEVGCCKENRLTGEWVKAAPGAERIHPDAWSAAGSASQCAGAAIKKNKKLPLAPIVQQRDWRQKGDYLMPLGCRRSNLLPIIKLRCLPLLCQSAETGRDYWEMQHCRLLRPHPRSIK